MSFSYADGVDAGGAGATEQAARVEEVSASMEQMAANIAQNSDNAHQTQGLALKAAQDAKEGGQAVAAGFRRMTGRITGPGTETSDSVPALLSHGEFVIRAASVRSKPIPP